MIRMPEHTGVTKKSISGDLKLMQVGFGNVGCVEGACGSSLTHSIWRRPGLRRRCLSTETLSKMLQIKNYRI